MKSGLKMKKLFIILIFIGFYYTNGLAQENSPKITQKVFAFGGDINQKFIQYVVDLTNKPNPKICYVPTASADNPDNIKYWNYICRNLSIDPFVLKVWVKTDPAAKSFEEILLDMDAIVVGGGNTLNMMGIWKAQGIDSILRKALEKGIILAGGSAGSICWFQNGVSDSRPVNLSVVEGLSFLPYSNCPHYSDSLKKQFYHHLIKNKKIKAGYACDDRAGVLFENGTFKEAVSQNDINNVYFISITNGNIRSKKIKPRILINQNALSISDYTTHEVNKVVDEFSEINNQDNPLNAFLSVRYIFANGRQSHYRQVTSIYLQNRLSDTISDSKVNDNQRSEILKTSISKVLVYNDSVAGIINKMYPDFYGVWYFYKENGRWMSAGEDFGGETVFEAEISFREKASMHLDKVRNLILHQNIK